MNTSAATSQPGWRGVALPAFYLNVQIPERLTPLNEFTDAEHVAYGIRDAGTGEYREVLEIYRYPRPPGASPSWRAELDEMATRQGWRNVVVSEPKACIAGGVSGALGTFRFVVGEKNTIISGNIWTANVGKDRVVIVFRWDAERDEVQVQTFGFVLGSVVFAPLVSPIADRTEWRGNQSHRGVQANQRERLVNLPPVWRNIVGVFFAATILVSGTVWVTVRNRGAADSASPPPAEAPRTSNVSSPPAGTIQHSTPQPTSTIPIGARVIGHQVTLAHPHIQFMLPQDVPGLDTSDSGGCADFSGQSRVAICSIDSTDSLTSSWDSVRFASTLSYARNNASQILLDPFPLQNPYGITGVEGSITYLVPKADVHIIEWIMVGVTPKGERFWVYYQTTVNNPQAKNSPDHLIRDSITPL